MSLENSNPSLNPADNDSLTGTFRHVLNKILQSVNVCLPASVVAYDREQNVAQVQPQVMLLATDGSQFSRAQIASVPVFQIGGGGFILNFNLKPGDLGWIIANDRDISLFMQGYSEAKPNTFRTHDFSDSVFFPNPMTGYSINSEDEENAVLQTMDGTTRISIFPNKVKITSPQPVEIDGDLLVTGNIIVDGDSTINGREIVYGDIASGGDITAAGNITPGTPIPP